ncbi:MAG TPA: hypothetical protein VMT23_03545 [Candidatus Binatia bacterium]|nr:hypothetical protein [Candidatus Binatia bacterium]
MPSFNIPAYPRYTFPRLQKGASPEQILEICSEVLDNFGDIVDACHPDVRKNLLTGTVNARVWAFHQARKQAESKQTADLEVYYQKLEDARLLAMESPMATFMHRTVHEGLSIVAEPTMSYAARTQLRESLAAVRNWEADAEQHERASGNGGRSSSDRRSRARRETVPTTA